MPTLTEQHLANLGVTKAQARQFIVDNLTDLKKIYFTCLEYKVTSAMLAEIYGGVQAKDVLKFFNDNGFNANFLDKIPLVFEDTKLDFSSDARLITTGSQPTLSNGVTLKFNSERDLLSNEVLREVLKKEVGSANYNKVFSLSGAFGKDGVLKADEIGIKNLTDLDSVEEMESLLFGTIVSFAKTIDQIEAYNFSNFVKSNKAAIDAKDPIVLEKYRDLYNDMVSDKALSVLQELSTQDITEAVKIVGQDFVEDAISNPLGYSGALANFKFYFAVGS
jgi:hypothetical protein